MAVCMKFIFILANTGEQNGCSSDTRSDKQINTKILYVYMDLLISSPVLFESPRGDRNYYLALYVEVGKGCHRQ